MQKLSFFVACMLLIFLSCASEPFPEPSPNTAQLPAVGAHGMVSTAHPLATEAGLDILRAGGNAFDAAVAIAAVLNVVEPMMSGAGGYGTILVYDADSARTLFLNCSSRIPAYVNSDVFRPPTPGFKDNRHGAMAVSTPGNVQAWEAMHRRFGSLRWARLFDRAIHLAENGFDLNGRTAFFISRAFKAFPPHARSIYGRNAQPLRAGERLVQADLGRTLQHIAQEGAAYLQRGALAQAIDAAIRQAGGFLSLADLQASRAEWWQPIAIDYRGYRVVTASPPATAFPSLIRLGLMSCFDVKAAGHNSAGYLHRFAEASKHAFWCRLRYAGDPDIAGPPLDRLLSRAYWQEQAQQIDPRRATPFEPPAQFSEGDMHTTHFVVADRRGNIVSATQTLGNVFGSRIMPRGTGVWLNNSLAYCTFEPKGNPMDAHAGRHKLSGDCPTLVFKDGRPWAALGTPGGHTIGQTVPQIVMNLIDFEMDMQQAIAAPRISFIEPDWLAVEQALPQAVQDSLASFGHRLRRVRGLGNAHGLTIERDARGRIVRFTGGADPRGSGLAKGM